MDLGYTLIYECTVGSHAYGLAHEGSDIDTRGIFLPTADLQWGIHKVPEQFEGPGEDQITFELEKFLVLALKANPTALEILYTDLVATRSELSDALRAMRGDFLSRRVYASYGGYIKQQFRKMRTNPNVCKELGIPLTENTPQREEPKPMAIIRKHSMHMVRLMYSGIHTLRHKEVMVDVGEHREELLGIRSGAISLKEAFEKYQELQIEYDAAELETTLPAEPNFTSVNDFLLKARRSMVI